MTCFCFFRRKKRASTSEQRVEFDREVAGIENTRLFTYKELRRATENFSPANKIGEGGFGSVYKGQLRDGTFAAVKVLATQSRQGVREFLTEINVIAEIEHENLVKLHGCCVEDGHRILVYGYLEKNSLARTLLGGDRSNLQFSWPTRCKICIGVAKGLTFLHEEVQPHIIHRDIKASNILLDYYLTPKISDFGLARIFPSDLTHVSTRVAGTAGYLAPEYAINGQLTRKADVYSFGVLLLEIVSGRPHTNRRLPYSEQYLLETAWELHERGALIELVDASLNEDYDAEEASRYIKIGLLCVQESPKLRPSMSAIIEMLTGEINVTDKEISRPGLIGEFMDMKVYKDKIRDTKKAAGAPSDSSSKMVDSSSSSGKLATSFATMTFTSIYDRTC